ncbi:cupin 2 domain-containing protein [Caballeronia udeis]|uniref:Cupin 2 domain-containing protein n=1 Tax=Caballeronia udeis TaxID=1232866 RepID=A0A158K0S0_9BURK|nr:cupin domain-containing protein [Caballeronia udeis]SAL74151.1 cupin 2 domain-containing protein [Caballeronia udeis]
MSRIKTAVAALMFALCGVAHADDTGQEKIQPVMRQAIPEAAGKNVLVATVSYVPGQASEAHMHRGSVFAYVLEGHVVSQLEGSAAKTYEPGESWYEAPGSHHLVSRNPRRQTTCRVI